jgi:hypothetical protein
MDNVPNDRLYRQTARSRGVIVMHKPEALDFACAPLFPEPVRFTPLRVARWRWTGKPDIVDVDVDDDAVDELELRRSPGEEGMGLLRGETSGPLGLHEWGGDRHVFRLADADRDGRGSRRELDGPPSPHRDPIIATYRIATPE